MYDLMIFEMTVEQLGQLIPVLLIAQFDDFVSCMIWNNQFTEALQQIPLNGTYLSMCVRSL